jgi:hypothetical protein
MVLHPARRRAFPYVVLMAAVFASACGRETLTTPATRSPGLKPSYGMTGTVGWVYFCKNGPPGTYTFHIDAADGNLPYGQDFDITIPNGQTSACLSPVIWEAASSSSNITKITVTETGSAGTQVLGWDLTNTAGYPPKHQDGGDSFTFDAYNDNVFLLTVTDGPTPPPPTGKTFTIGPSSMEGHLKIDAGDFFNGGYSFKFKSNTHAATQFSVTAMVQVPVTCPYGGGPGGTITIDLGTRVYNVPAGNTNWLPTGDANSILSWQGSTVTPDLCGGFPMDNARGAIFTATVSQDPASGSLVDFRFKYRDPAAKGKPNTDCTNAADPNRNRADVCGASWSQTVTDP